MRKLTLFALCAFVFALSGNAQQKYKEIKNQYNPKDYVSKPGDLYNPALAGIASFLVPGLGQMITKEGGRGAGFLVGYVGLVVISSATSESVASDGTIKGNATISTITLLGALGVGIASIVDAVRVAKVKNLAYRDNPSSKIQLQLKPYVDTSASLDGIKPHAGLSLSIKFR